MMLRCESTMSSVNSESGLARKFALQGDLLYLEKGEQAVAAAILERAATHHTLNGESLMSH